MMSLLSISGRWMVVGLRALGDHDAIQVIGLLARVEGKEQIAGRPHRPLRLRRQARSPSQCPEYPPMPRRAVPGACRPRPTPCRPSNCRRRSAQAGWRWPRPPSTSDVARSNSLDLRRAVARGEHGVDDEAGERARGRTGRRGRRSRSCGLRRRRGLGRRLGGADRLGSRHRRRGREGRDRRGDLRAGGLGLGRRHGAPRCRRRAS